MIFKQKSLTKVVISSKGTLSQQESLLKLPLPSLSETIEKWLPTTLPHLSNSEYQVTKQVANDFIQNAEPLQKFLSDRATQKDNWVSRKILLIGNFRMDSSSIIPESTRCYNMFWTGISKF